MQAQDRNTLILAHVPLVRRIVRQFQTPRRIEREDLVGVGLLALCKAADQFDPDKGMRFESFAYLCIQRDIQNMFTVDARRRLYPDEDGFAEELPDAYREEQTIDRIVLEEAMATLNAEQQEIIRAAFYRGEEQKDTRVRLGLYSSMYQRRYAWAIDNLRRYLSR